MQQPTGLLNAWSHYQEVRVLGHGSTGIVRLVRLRRDPHRKFAIKSIVLSTLPDALRQGVNNEVVMLQDLDHANIIRYVSSFVEGDTLHIVMEYAPEGTLRRQYESSAASSSSLRNDVILEWFVELCSALSYLHSRRICHRDVKAENIYLSRTHHVKLGDFGISTLLSTARPSAQTVIGTPLYFAPELCEGVPYTEKCDVWALGVVLYELCNKGRPPFHGNSLAAVVRSVLEDAVPPFIPNSTAMDPRFEFLCRAMLEKDPARRPSITSIMSGYIRLPPSHPSHPLFDPNKARQVQKVHGPRNRKMKGGVGCSAVPQPPGPDGSAHEQQQRKILQPRELNIV